MTTRKGRSPLATFATGTVLLVQYEYRYYPCSFLSHRRPERPDDSQPPRRSNKRCSSAMLAFGVGFVVLVLTLRKPYDKNLGAEGRRPDVQIECVE